MSANLCVYLCAFVCESVSVMQSEHLAPLCSTTLAQTRESVDYWMQLQRVGQTIKIDSAFAFYHTPNTAEVKACEPWAASILIMIENMQPLNWEAYLYFFKNVCLKKKGGFFIYFCLFVVMRWLDDLTSVGVFLCFPDVFFCFVFLNKTHKKHDFSMTRVKGKILFTTMFSLNN